MSDAKDSTERLGQLLVRMGYLNPKQVREILDYQKDYPGILFGQIAVMLGYLSRERLEDVI